MNALRPNPGRAAPSAPPARAAPGARCARRCWRGRALGAVLVLTGALNAAPPPVIRRGIFIRNELLGIDHAKSFTCELVSTNTSQPRILVTALDQRTYREAPIYQKLIDRTPEELDRSKKRYELIGEIRGTTTTREETVPAGPWANEPFRFNGIPVRTDTDGVFADSRDWILARFDRDDLGKTAARASIVHARLGEFILEIDRNDFLAAFGVAHMYDPGNAKLPGWDRYDRLAVRALYPESVEPGGAFRITLEVENPGKRHTGEIVGRALARSNWLAGKNFYIGILGPGAKRSFTRTFHVPENAAPGTYYAVLGLYDHILRNMPEKNPKLRLRLGEK